MFIVKNEFGIYVLIIADNKLLATRVSKETTNLALLTEVTSWVRKNRKSGITSVMVNDHNLVNAAQKYATNGVPTRARLPWVDFLSVLSSEVSFLFKECTYRLSDLDFQIISLETKVTPPKEIKEAIEPAKEEIEDLIEWLATQTWSSFALSLVDWFEDRRTLTPKQLAAARSMREKCTFPMITVDLFDRDENGQVVNRVSTQTTYKSQARRFVTEWMAWKPRTFLSHEINGNITIWERKNDAWEVLIES